MRRMSASEQEVTKGCSEGVHTSVGGLLLLSVGDARWTGSSRAWKPPEQLMLSAYVNAAKLCRTVRRSIGADALSQSGFNSASSSGDQFEFT
jgi:hypothetical protein